MRIVVKDGAYFDGKVRILAKVFPERGVAWQADGNNRMNPNALLTMGGDFTVEEVRSLINILSRSVARAEAGLSDGSESGIGNELRAEPGGS